MPRRSRLAVGVLLVLLSGFQGSAQPSPPNGFVGSHVWTLRDKAFGGLSAIEVAEGGRSFVALGDKAILINGQIERDKADRISGVAAGPVRPLIGVRNGKPLTGRRADSEGLAIAPSGEAFVSFEQRVRVARLDLQSGTVRDLEGHPAFASLPTNAAIEALAIGPGPTLYALPEGSTAPDIPVYRWQGGTWDDTLSLPRDGRFVPVAADIGPDGRFYLLERDFRGLGGFSSRLRRFDLTPDGFRNAVLLLETPFGLHENLEGLSIWRDDGGQLRATMISDDNFTFVLQTRIVEYRLPD